jgi:hypothetical protein
LSHAQGSLALKIGTVLLVLSLLGNMPVIKLRSKIWARGIQISGLTNFRSLRLIPSISVLCLLGNDLIMSRMCGALID